MGYNSYSLPIPFQDLAFEIQRTLFRGFDRMEFSSFRQVDDVLPGAAQDLRRFRCVDDSVGSKVPEISRRQRNTFADPVEHRIRNGHVHIPRNAVSARLHLHMLKIIWLLEKDLKRFRPFKVLLQITFLHRTVPKKYQQTMILQRQHICKSLSNCTVSAVSLIWHRAHDPAWVWLGHPCFRHTAGGVGGHFVPRARLVGNGGPGNLR